MSYATLQDWKGKKKTDSRWSNWQQFPAKKQYVQQWTLANMNLFVSRGKGGENCNEWNLQWRNILIIKWWTESFKTGIMPPLQRLPPHKDNGQPISSGKVALWIWYNNNKASSQPDKSDNPLSSFVYCGVLLDWMLNIIESNKDTYIKICTQIFHVSNCNHLH